MTLTDTGPLVALLDSRDPNHLLCRAAAEHLPPGPMATTLPCFTETVYFIGKAGGWAAQKRLWQLCETQRLIIMPWDEKAFTRARSLMANYKDVPMDFADATLVAAAESVRKTLIFTIDRHFHAFRSHGNTPFVIVP